MHLKSRGERKEAMDPKSRYRSGLVKSQEGCCQASRCVVNHTQNSVPRTIPLLPNQLDMPTATATSCCRNACTKLLGTRLPDHDGWSEVTTPRSSYKGV